MLLDMIDTVTSASTPRLRLLTILALLLLPNLAMAEPIGIWTTPQELAALPMEGAAWDAVLAAAHQDTSHPDISNQEDPTNVRVLAKALVCVRTGNDPMCDMVRQAVMDAIGTENGGRTLALGVELTAYVIAADLVGLSASDDQQFRVWLRSVLTKTLDGKTLQSTHEDRPNNWGTYTGASRAAVAIYLGDQAELDRTAMIFHGWLGNRAVYDGFSYGDLDWQSDPSRPVGINPVGATHDGHSIDGALPEEMRRAGSFTWPPPKENYVYAALQGALVQATILYRAGYDVWNWEDRALLRAFEWLHNEADFPAVGDDTWQPHLINYYYRSKFPAPTPTQAGKNVGWSDWTHTERFPSIVPLPPSDLTAE
jgi:hypothetical protein